MADALAEAGLTDNDWSVRSTRVRGGHGPSESGCCLLVDLSIIVVALLALTLGAEMLVRGSISIARRLGVSGFFIGLTIVGFGTSTPELCTSLVAAARGEGDIGVGNVVGSNIFNIAVILGVTALISPIPLQLHMVRRDVLVVIAVACTPLVTMLTGGVIDRWLGVLMVAALLAYLWRGYITGTRQNQRDLELAAERELEDELAPKASGWLGRPVGSAVLIVAGLCTLVAGSTLLVNAASSFARGLGVSELVIGLTIVAAGTSAPELVTSLVAALRKQSDISVGNILGSNIFNILGILGLTCAITPQQITPQVFALDIPVMIAVSIACIPIMRSGARISRGEGVLLLGVYAAYMVVLFVYAPSWFATG